jgi:hypothetical protein
MKNVYYKGKLIPVKDWDFETRRPKEKIAKAKKASEDVVAEPTPEVTEE